MRLGGMAEWSKAAVLKTAEVHASVGSNPTPSANDTFPTAKINGSTASCITYPWPLSFAIVIVIEHGAPALRLLHTMRSRSQLRGT